MSLHTRRIILGSFIFAEEDEILTVSSHVFFALFLLLRYFYLYVAICASVVLFWAIFFSLTPSSPPRVKLKLSY